MRKTLALITIALVTLGACAITDIEAGAPKATPAAPAVELVQNSAPVAHSELSQIVEDALPSVVNVKVRAVDQTGMEGRGEGSGVIIDPKGIILTNNHVIDGAVSVRVVFNDDHEPLDGVVIGADPDRDLAIIKVDATDLSAMPIGHSGRMKLGDDVVAIGFPLGLGGPTVTKGILSGQDREITAQGSALGQVERLVGMLQTDAAINPGNSGGALIDIDGNLIGINTAVAGSAENVGFAIAIDGAIPVVEKFLSDPAEETSWLGVSLAKDLAEAQALGFPSDLQGALIMQVIPRGPAEAAGIEDGTMVTAIDTTDITSSAQFIDELSQRSPGDRVTLEMVTRSGETQRLTVELDARPFQFLEPTSSPSPQD
jgi:S1-C subfamily serine protease